VTRDLDTIIAALTIEEKASLCSGRDFWTTKAVERLGILSWMMTDGPHGLRKQRPDSGQIGLVNSVPATCFPTGAGLASTWNRELLEEVGRALGRESKAERVGVILGPAVNIKRSPLCGRNFEYLSEDPYLAGELAKHHIRGVQSQGVGASIKHFAANNQEKSRMLIDAIIDERTLREIYLPAFEIAVKEAQPWTVMCSYNRINGTYASEHPWLLAQVLKKEWGHRGMVVTDWGACDDRVAGLKAGEDFEMPGNAGITDAEIVAAVEDGSLPVAVLDAAVTRILDVTFRVLDNMDPKASFDAKAHHALARRAASESMVLLKNEGALLPLLNRRRVAFIGAFAKTPRYQGGGSSHITPTEVDDALEEARDLVAGTCVIDYAAGYSVESDEDDSSLLAEARAVASSAEVAVLFIGLTDNLESEAFDRADMRIPRNHTALLEEVLTVQKNLIVVLSNGAPVEMPWIDAVPSVLEGYLGGQAWGGAVADILFGRVSPSGKLAETFPKRLEDNPSFLNFPGEATKVEYREGLFVGYRYYDTARVEPLFPFGHGLSYSSFEYANLRLDKSAMRDTERLEVSVEVLNAGAVEAKEVVQLYIGDEKSSVARPKRELKAFRKIDLKPGERATVSFSLDKRAFAFWSPPHADWIVETGTFEIAVGASSRDLRLRTAVEVQSTAPDLRHWDLNASLRDVAEHPLGEAFAREIMPRLAAIFGTYDPSSPEAAMIEAMVKDMPLRNVLRMCRTVSGKEITNLLGALNGKMATAKETAPRSLIKA
jgi:beta-glucosidase